MEVRTPSIPLWLQEIVDSISLRTEPLPAVLEDFGVNGAVTPPVATWAPVTGTKNLTFGDLARPLEVVAYFGGISWGTTGGYTMVGVDASGNLNLEPDYAADGTRQFGYAPYSEAPERVRISGVKSFIVPAGAATNFRLSFRRNTAVARSLDYSHLLIVPTRWIDVVEEEETE